MIVTRRDILVLNRSYTPEIKGSKILQSNEYGGQLLVYKLYTIEDHKIQIFNKIIKIKSNDKFKKEIYFLRPFKDRWDVTSHRLPPYLWGKKNKPLTNVWCQIKGDISTINTEEPRVKIVQIYKNHVVRNLLKDKTPIIEKNQISIK